jgi:hypothetical protein
MLVLAPVPRAPLLGLGKAKACFCLLVGTLKLAQALRAGGPLSEGPRLVQLVTLAGVLSLCPKIVEVIGWHAHEYRAHGHSASSSHRRPGVFLLQHSFGDLLGALDLRVDSSVHVPSPVPSHSAPPSSEYAVSSSCRPLPGPNAVSVSFDNVIDRGHHSHERPVCPQISSQACVFGPQDCSPPWSGAPHTLYRKPA